jgi:hypothetical protein
VFEGESADLALVRDQRDEAMRQRDEALLALRMIGGISDTAIARYAERSAEEGPGGFAERSVGL